MGEGYRRRRRRRKSHPGRIFLLFLLLIGIGFGLHILLRDDRIAVAVDAGHGGSDPGALGLMEEVELTETTAGYLAEFLETDEHYRLILIRQPGEGMPLNERWRKANKQKAKLLLSLHANAAEDASAGGFEVYPALPGREFHEESVRFGRLVTEEIRETGIRIRGEDGIRYAYYQEDENGVSRKILRDRPDEALADCASFAMVEYPVCPAVLIEQCFVTSAEDTALLGTEEGCRRAALCYYHAICAYFGTEPII